MGDVYLKRLPFTLDPSFPKFEEVPPPFTQSVISSEPETRTRVITERDRFLIFASSGLWELLTNQQAVEIVHKNPKKVLFYFLLFIIIITSIIYYVKNL